MGRVIVTIDVDDAAQLAPLWPQLGGTATVQGIDEFGTIWMKADLTGPTQRRLWPEGEPQEPQPVKNAEGVQGAEPAAPSAEPETSAAPEVSGTAPPTTFPLAERILRILAADPEITWTTTDLHDELGAHTCTYGSVNACLSALLREGEIQRPARGKYQAAPQ